MFPQTLIVFLIALIAVSAVMTVTLTGRPRGPITPGAAAASVVVAAIQITVLVILFGRVS